MPGLRRRCDVLVAGAGIAGLAAGLALARGGLRTVCVDPAPEAPPTGEAARAVALLPASVHLLRRLGAWDDAAAAAQPIREFRFSEAGSRGAAPLLRAADIDAPALAWNVANHVLRRTLRAAAATALTRLQSTRITSLSRREDVVLAGLSSGERVSARLLVAADGRQSATRREAGIAVRRLGFGRRILSFLACVPSQPPDVCFETHGHGGTAARVPLPGGRVAAVWALPGVRAARLLGGGAAAVAAAFGEFAGLPPGGLRLQSDVHDEPEQFLAARRLAGRRLALAGEAAHGLSPVGAQGLNLSLGDAAALGALAEAAAGGGLDPGGEELLAAYAGNRERDMRARTAAVLAYARLAGLEGGFASRARGAAARTLQGLPQLRSCILRAASRGSWLDGGGERPLPQALRRTAHPQEMQEIRP